MKTAAIFITKRALRAILISSFLVSAMTARAVDGPVYVLTDANSSVTINAGDSAGMNNWVVDGNNQLYKQWFWYRKGNSTPEAGINTLALVSATQSSPSTLNTVYAFNTFSIEITYSLLGGSPGSGNSDIGEQVKITNLTGNNLDFHFFQYTDFDLNGNPAGDTVQLGQNLQGLFNQAIQYKPGVQFSDTVVSPGANHGEAGLSPTTYLKLNDGNVDTLNDNPGPMVGDSTWAFQWDFLIGPHGSRIISIDKNLFVTTIPEPSFGSLLPLGLILFGVSKRYLSRAK